ncbi:hypothetical protein [Microtetraspora malaysiensis]|uniref:Uncharacterized protein n=1 Tax=Microtetraspora malaysiensis TaxID=161358 RepID=A0ABW6SU95_9ACTN
MTKYDPRLRDASGAFVGDDWTSICEIGQTFDGRVLTRRRYEQVESAYLMAVELFAQESGPGSVYPADAADQPGALVAVLPDEDGIVRARWA